jgi:hypothetical protein
MSYPRRKSSQLGERVKNWNQNLHENTKQNKEKWAYRSSYLNGGKRRTESSEGSKGNILIICLYPYHKNS